MNRTVRYITLTLVAPVATAMLLGGIARQNAHHVKPVDVEPFHEAAKAAIAAEPYTIGSWAGTDMAVPQEAVKLLNSNIIISRKYVNTARLDEWASLLIVQCRDSRDMTGHYPPVCYPGQGEELVKSTPMDVTIAGMSIPLMEYLFQRHIGDQAAQRYIYNFMAVPGVGLIRDMDGLHRAAEDYQRRYFGAAQFQLLLPAELSEQERLQILNTFFTANADLIKLLKDGLPAELPQSSGELQ